METAPRRGRGERMEGETDGETDREMGEKREIVKTETQVQRGERQRLRGRRGNETVSGGEEKPPVSRESQS